MTQPGYQAVPLAGGIVKTPGDAAAKSWVRLLAEALNRMMSGKINVVLPVTLTANSATTEVIDARIGAYSALLLQELTANAAAAKYTSPYVLPADQKSGQVTLNHANNGETDRNFNLVILG